ncbi:MAG: TM0106 family RecB-like putative nuclease [Planctomycetota bacterium]|nr:TM0106 family RecB-like putative nuclease [Planctomycetota bacterium]
MRILDDQLVLSPSDLANFLTCRHRAGLDLAVAHKQLTRPVSSNPYAAILKKHGEEHEQAYVESLRAQGLRVVEAGVSGAAGATGAAGAAGALRVTLDAMKGGVDVVVQARLEGQGMAGWADVLRRVENPSALGAWSYEAQDTKLARETKGGTILQLSAYSDMLAGMQRAAPDRFHVVTPIGAEAYRLADFAAYYRMVRSAMERELATGHERLIAGHYPEPVDACQVCAWEGRCETRRRRDDHLSYIASSGRSHRVELTAQGIGTLTAAAEMPVPVTFKPARGARETYDRLGHQARVQHQQRTEKRPIVEMLPIEEGVGLRRLPEPSVGDIFLDLEGARFAREGGREYLFGIADAASYRAWWAVDDAQEKAAFEDLMDLISAACKVDPGMHVYHFNHYEPTAFKKLASRYVTRVEELNELLRAERFVDLYPIVRQAVRAGVESYSIKKLEQYYEFTRQVSLADVHQPLIAVEMALESKAPDAIDQTIRDAVQGYNEDDCRSTLALRNWLERLRDDAIATGADVPRPVAEKKEPQKKTIEMQQRAEALRARLLATVPPEAADPAHADHATWLLAYLVDWHRREVNAEWWEFFRLRDLPEEDLYDERKAVAGLEFKERVSEVLRKNTGKPTGSVIDRYSYPPQDIEVKGKLNLQTGKTFGAIEAHNRDERTLDVRKGETMADVHPRAAFAADSVSVDVLQEAVMRLADSTLSIPGALDQCGPQLLLSKPPRLRSGRFAAAPSESAQDFAVRISTDLDRTVLPIQGPPGAGKTYIGAQMILAVVKAGKKVGVTATSHKVIRNLLDEVVSQAGKTGQTVKVGAKPSEPSEKAGPIVEFSDNDAPLAAISCGEVDVLGGTAFLWAREEFADAVDVLFVDEAGQMSLANVLAVSHAAESIVLLGDPQQLDQPEKASHPDGVGISALEHVLGGRETMPADRGIFLPITWRMSPTITVFTSELFYERKLESRAGLDVQVLRGAGAYDGSHLWLVPVEHDGNQSSSMEEVDAIEALVKTLLAPGSQWIDENGIAQPLTGNDLRVVAPFNAQVNRIADRLARAGGPDLSRAKSREGPPLRQVQVGTVDKFQGQTCAVVIYSMTTSRPEDAPRGMEFLYSLNRLNVATSRARCAVFLVASPRLFEPECRTPRQMQLANALCRYKEMARQTQP